MERIEAQPHPWRKLISRYIKDINQPVWIWRKEKDDWEKTGYPLWDKDKFYALGPNKPTHKPRRFVKYEGGSIQFPMPETEELENGKEYYYVRPAVNCLNTVKWKGSNEDKHRLATGTVHLTSSAASSHFAALREIMSLQLQKWAKE